MENFAPGIRSLNPPLGLATLAGLSPDDWDIEIVDENIQSVPIRPDADIVGVCGMGVQIERQKELLSFYRSKGCFVVAGGSYASLCPEAYETVADSVVAGEAEYIWPEFCRDFAAGQPKRLYRETGVVSLEDSVVPRFDLLDLNKYQAVSLQFSRGCPFRCEFCDIIVMFGRKPRTKPLDLVRRELDALRHLGARSMFFVDDNLIGNKPRAKELLRFLIDYQREHNYQVNFGTEASLNLARDDELMVLFRQANFRWVFIGIESPDEGSLRETKKMQNTSQDILESVRKIYSYGIDILAGFIVGFDNDTTKTFDLQYQFITHSGIQSAMIGLLMAVPKTPLYERLEREGRLITDSGHASDNSKLRTNVMPKGMTYTEMIDGYRKLHYRLFSDRGIADRVKNKVRYLAPFAGGSKYTTRQIIHGLKNFTTRALVPGGPSRVFHFFRSLPFSNPRLIPVAVEDWAIGLSMRDYMDRHFVQEFHEDTKKVRFYVDKVKLAFRHRRHNGAVGVSLSEVKNAAAAVSFSMNGWLEHDSFRSVAHHAEHLLDNTRSSITLHIREFNQAQLQQLARLLNGLARYGDRIHIRMDEASRRIIAIDSSIFNLDMQTD